MSEGNCSVCGMTNRNHLLLTGRGLHAHRPDPTADYVSQECRRLCMWCHSRAHGNSPSHFPRKYIPGGTRREDVELPLPLEEIERLDTLARQLRMSRAEAVMTGLALLQIELEKSAKGA